MIHSFFFLGKVTHCQDMNKFTACVDEDVSIHTFKRNRKKVHGLIFIYTQVKKLREEFTSNHHLLISVMESWGASFLKVHPHSLVHIRLHTRGVKSSIRNSP